MVKLPKFENPEQDTIREFVPRDPDLELSAGRLIVRANSYGSILSKFDGLFDVMAADALTFEPPIELDRDDVEVIHYAGRHYAGTYGLEVTIPEGHAVPVEYTRISQVEATK